MTTAAVSGVHIHRQSVRFGDCDPAGIVYYPRLIHYFHVAMETWFHQALDYRYEALILGRQVGFPCVHCEADFRAPCELGAELAVELRVVRLGASSIHFDYRVRTFEDPAASPRLTGATVCVVMDLDPDSPTHRRARAIPADLRRRIEAFMAGEAVV